MALLVKNAKIVSGPDVIDGDLFVDQGVIHRIDRDIPAGPAEVIDAGGRYCLPGGVDAHTHFDLDLGAFRARDDFLTGSIAAAVGGTTTVVDHVANGPDGCRLGDPIRTYRDLAAPAVIDYSFHGVIQHVDDQVLDDMAALIPEGITSHKIYMTYANRQDDDAVLRVLERAKELGVTVCFHCENDAIIAFLRSRFLARRETAPRFHPLSRPDYSEAESVNRVLAFARAAGDARAFIVHLSTALGLDVIRRARERGQANVFAETCPQYLLLDDSRYDDPDEGLKYIMAPPLRKRSDNQILWEGLRRRDIDTVATDHCPFSFELDKHAGRNDFSKCPGGIPGVEARLSLLYSEGFMAGRMAVTDVARVTATRPAEIFGLFPKKGILRPGSDADFVIWDQNAAWTIRHDALHERVDYTPYEGFHVLGKPVLTVSRGEIIARDGQFVGTPGRGRFIKRTLGS